jgi:exosortase/archaeosortase family protein
MLPVWCVLWLAVPLPFNWDQYLIRSLQRAATLWASGMLDLGGVRHLPDGVVIRIPERDFFVDEACSGVHSLFASLAFTGVLMAASGRGLFVAGFMVASAVGWVLLGNVIRVCSVVVLAGRYGLPVVEGLGHELLGVVIFALVVGLILSTDRLTRFFFPGQVGLISRLIAAWRSRAAAAKPAKAATAVAAAADPVRRGRAALVPLILAGAFAALAAAGWTHPHRRALASLSKDLDQFKPAARETLPAELDGWRQDGFEVRRREVNDPAGMLSRIWTYRKGRLTAAVSVDGPYAQWHDLADCYRGLGFTVLSQRDVPLGEAEASAGGYTELQLQNDRGRHGLVLFMAYTESNRPVAPRGGDPLSLRFGAGLMGWSGQAGGFGGELVYDVQLLSESGLNFTASEQADLKRLFHSARRIIAKGEPASSRPAPQGRGEGGAP